MNECEGCASRDRMIEILSKRIDELEKLRDEDVVLAADTLEVAENGRT